jgi:hypothetical protein
MHAADGAMTYLRDLRSELFGQDAALSLNDVAIHPMLTILLSNYGPTRAAPRKKTITVSIHGQLPVVGSTQ